MFPGGFRKKTNSWCAKMVANLNVLHLKKSHCVQIAEHIIFFGEALVVMCTFIKNNKKKTLSLWALSEVTHYTLKI